MHPAIRTVYEGKRGCGYRDKIGGLYLRSDGESQGCGRLPIPLTTCTCCGQGIKPARGWTWVNGTMLLAQVKDQPCSGNCSRCPVNGVLTQNLAHAGLLWIGESFYPTPEDFNDECRRMGISRRIAQVPREFVAGQTWVLLAHRKAIPAPVEFGKEPEYQAGIFRVFRPDRIEVVVDGTEPDEQIEGYLKRQLVPVKVERVGEARVVGLPAGVEA